MLPHFAVVMVGTKFSENVGSAARAMANMGVGELVLAAPRGYDEARALSLATPKGAAVLRNIRVEPDLAAALAPYAKVYATTARTGGWRREVATPAQVVAEMHEVMAEGEAGRVAVVFGPEDRGLTNEEIEVCGQVVTIPTVDDASSLNVAQAVLVLCYEVFKSRPGKPFRPAGAGGESRLATHAEQEALFAAMQEALTVIDFLKGDNPAYWMLPVRRFLQRMRLRRREVNLLMGVCRQVLWMASLRERPGP